ncbi:GAD-like domain-containing protein [uncultured Aquimonas sp.]|uniref:GAD-like domain-containing protein n=1 Tax=uncultured Aquimonas sp. TaxID=385483 RepID=UPI00086C7981|nr:GAD-like domain-containing protein [uncultured Aquimonas sp.]ODU41167.1 MAG: glutamyl-tRNA amidotransferase [Xanthomonadaceae bacterium SCN 69-123]
MDVFMDNFLGFKGFAPAVDRRDVPPEKIARFRGKLPDKLLEYWQVYGWCGYAKGLFWTVDPDDWADTIDDWLGGTSYLQRDTYYVIARSAFGKLVLWGTGTGPSLKIVAPYGWVFPAFDPETFSRRGADKELQLFFASSSLDTYDLNDANEKPLFEQALARLGPLSHDTMYGFVPALALGGVPSVERLQIVDAHVHLNILSQVTELDIMRDVAEVARS